MTPRYSPQGRGFYPIVGLDPRIALLAALAAGLAMPNAAAASTVGGDPVDDESIVYRADPGELNDVTVSRDGDRIVFDDQGAEIVATPGCTAITASRVSCEPLKIIAVYLGDGNDEGTSSGQLELDSLGGAISFWGQRGDDSLRGATDENVLLGGQGHDVLTAGAGTLEISAVQTSGGSATKMAKVHPDRDTVVCTEPASKTASSPRTASVDRLDSITGACGQVFHYTKDAVISRGSSGPDLLGGTAFPTYLYGRGGPDRLFGGNSTADRMSGGRGDDRIESGGLLLGGAGDDHLTSNGFDTPVHQHGGPGDDRLIGGYRADLIVGGRGHDRIFGRAGNDDIRARDGKRDTIRCGRGQADRVTADRIDTVASNCDLVARDPAA